MTMKMRVQVPATSANLGPGFDCIGLALGLYNYIDFEPTDKPGELFMTAEGEEAADVGLGPENLIYQSFCRAFAWVGRPVPGIRMHCVNNVPMARGLGSSSAAIIGGVVMANALLEGRLDEESILRIALEFDGHPDNIAPALLGGIVLSGLDGENIFYKKITPPANLYCYGLVPDYHLPTSKARAALPGSYSKADAVFNISRMGLLVDALHTGDLAQLKVAMADRLHQPYRSGLITGMAEVAAAARTQGACGVAISGAGPTILILNDGPADFELLREILRDKGVESRLLALHPVNEGAKVTPLA